MLNGQQRIVACARKLSERIKVPAGKARKQSEEIMLIHYYLSNLKIYGIYIN